MDKEIKHCVKKLERLPPKELREILSGLATFTPDVVYWPRGFLDDFPDKLDGRGVSMGRMGQGALLLCNAASSCIRSGETKQICIGGISHGGENKGDWVITIMREGDAE